MAKDKFDELTYKQEGLRRAKLRKAARRDKRHGTCKCGKNRRVRLHACPFAIEMHDDYSETCSCCDECTKECAADV